MGADLPGVDRTPSPRTGRGFLWTVLPWLVCVGLTLAAYGGSLRAGIMFDAALDLPRATERGWLQILTGAGASPYFRPVTLLLWKACYELLGRNDFAVLHGLSLASHAVCGWLVYQLSRRLLDRAAGLAAAALFIWFPLSYQVVAFVDSLFHSLAALWVLAAALLYWDARRLRSRRRFAAALVCSGLALFTHEGTAALLLPAIAGLEVLGQSRLRKPSWSLWPAAFAAETAGFVALWAVVPRWPSTPHLDLPSLELNAAYFVQALASPATMLLGRLPRWGAGDVSEVLAVTAAAAVGILALAAVRHRLGVALFALVWFAAALALPAALLPWPNYVIDAPRLLYAASAGIVLFWTAALAPRRLTPWQGLGSLLLLAALAESWSFLAIRERLLDRGAAVVRQVMDTAAQPGPDGGHTYVNIPAFFGPKDADFLLGHSGVTMLPDYFGLDLEVAAATGRRLPIESLAYADLARPWTEAYGLQGRHVALQAAAAAVAGGGGVYVTRFDDPNELRLEYAGRVDPSAAAPGRAKATFGDWAAIEQAGASLDGDTLAIHLVWRALGKAPGDYTAFIHVVGDAPQPLAQSDGYPIAGLLPPQAWPAGALVYDERRVPLPSQVRGRQLRVLIGLYDRASPTTRARAVDAAGAPLPDDAFSLKV